MFGTLRDTTSIPIPKFKKNSPGKVVLDALAKVARIETCYNCDSLVNLPDTRFSTISASAYAFCS